MMMTRVACIDSPLPSNFCSVKMSSAGDKNHAMEKETDFDQFLQFHQPQLVSSGVPEWLWETLFYKLNNEVYDAGDAFMMTYMEEDEGGEETKEEDGQDGPSETKSGPKQPKLKVVAIKEDGLQCSDPNNIFLIDHAWTYGNAGQARQQLTQIPGLLQRMMSLMAIDAAEDKPVDYHVEKVLKEMWRFNQTYSVASPGASAEEKQPCWYMLDEFGSRIRHNDTPSCALVPFLYTSQQVAFTLLFPLRDLDYADEVTRDYAHYTKDPLLRQIHMLPWQPKDLSNLSTDQSEPNENYMKRVCNETPPDSDAKVSCEKPCGPLKVFTLDKQVQENLIHPGFVFVSSQEEADVLWLQEAWKDFKILAEKNQLVNQFPGEKLVITKDMLAVSGRRMGKKDQSRPGAKWLPVTFDLGLQLPQFVSYFQQQQKRDEPNIWILKPYNLARALDTTVTNDLNQIIRTTETNIPKVACEYIRDPVLFHLPGVGHVKFDLRFIMLLSSVEPLKLYAYKIFWIRFANKAFSLDHLDDYQKHFTVMNYAEDGTDWHQMLWKDFMPAFDNQFPGHTWEATESSLHAAIKELFVGAASKPHPFGLTHSPRSRAMYGIDAMLQWETDENGDKYMQPMILECNFMPDCERACWHRKEYFDDVFGTLFLDDTTDRPVVLL